AGLSVASGFTLAPPCVTVPSLAEELALALSLIEELSPAPVVVPWPVGSDARLAAEPVTPTLLLLLAVPAPPLLVAFLSLAALPVVLLVKALSFCAALVVQTWSIALCLSAVPALWSLALLSTAFLSVVLPVTLLPAGD